MVRGYVDRRPEAAANRDMALVRHVRGRRFPGREQFRHVTAVFSKRELRVFRASTVVFTIGILWVGAQLLGAFRIEVPAVGGRYTEAVVGGPQLVNPLFASVNDVDVDLVRLVYSGLFRYNTDQELVPDLAESYTLSEDKKTYTVVLRDHVLWHDGNPLTAADVAFTVESIQNPSVNSPLLVSFQGVNVSAPDDRTVVFTLKEPFPGFLASLTLGILPEHVWIDVPPEHMRLTQKNLRPVGSGPFRFEKLEKDDSGFILRYELSRNDQWYRRPPYLKTFVLEFYTAYDGTTGAIQQLRGQKIDALHFVPYDMRSRVARKHISLHTLQLPQYTALFFNQKQQPALEQATLRQALALSIDKDRIVRESLENEGQVIHSPILPGFPAYNPEIEKMAYDPAGANTLLDEVWPGISADVYRAKRREIYIAEWKAAERARQSASSTEAVSDENDTEKPDAAADEHKEKEIELTEAAAAEIESRLDRELNPAQTVYRMDKDGNTLSFTLVTNDSAEYVHTAELIAGFWQDIGVTTHVSSVPSKHISRDVLKKRNYDVLLYGMIVGEDPDQYPFWHSSQAEFPGLNLAQYVNRTLDSVLEKARETTDEEEQKKLYASFQETLLKDYPAIFLYTPTYTYAMSDKVFGFHMTRIAHPSDRLNGVADWYMKTDGTWGRAASGELTSAE